MSFADFCGVNFPPVARVSYQCDVIKHTVGKIWAQSCELALAQPCSVLPYVIHRIPAAWRLGWWGHGTDLLPTRGACAPLLLSLLHLLLACEVSYSSA